MWIKLFQVVCIVCPKVVCEVVCIVCPKTYQLKFSFFVNFLPCSLKLDQLCEETVNFKKRYGYCDFTDG